MNSGTVSLPLVGILTCKCIVKGLCISFPDLINEGSSFLSDPPQIPIPSPGSDGMHCLLALYE